MNMHKSLTELYAELCIEARAVRFREPRMICRHCNYKKAEHLGDGRCSSAVCSQTFASDEADRAEQIDRALTLIEELKAIEVDA